MTDQGGRDKDSRAGDHLAQARVRSASQSANGNELTLACERQAKQNFRLLLSATCARPRSGFWHFSATALLTPL